MLAKRNKTTWHFANLDMPGDPEATHPRNLAATMTLDLSALDLGFTSHGVCGFYLSLSVHIRNMEKFSPILQNFYRKLLVLDIKMILCRSVDGI